jgi:hypothetical protein
MINAYGYGEEERLNAQEPVKLISRNALASGFRG